MQRTERHIIIKSDPNWSVIDNLSFQCKNLYNKANYEVRQEFFNTSKEKEAGERDYAIWLRYPDLDKQAKAEEWEDYRILPACTAQQILRILEQNWKSFFKNIKNFQNNSSLGKPKPPKYKNKKKGRCSVIFTKNQFKLKDDYIYFPKKAGLDPIKTNQTDIQQVRLVPSATCYMIEVIYNKEVERCEDLDDSLYVGIDLGVSNLVTTTSNKFGLDPIIVNGRPLKSINQYFNKKMAKLMSFIGGRGTSNRLKDLLHKRNNKVQNYLHHTSRFVIDYCLENNIGNIIIGKNKNWKQNINIGRKNNQKFTEIPFQTLVNQIEYKAEEVGIKTQTVEESYTSKASFLDQDGLPNYKKGRIHKFSGKRVSRGLYKSKSGKLVNADVNGAGNILRKVVPKAFADGIEGLALNPVKVSFNENS